MLGYFEIVLENKCGCIFIGLNYTRHLCSSDIDNSYFDDDAYKQMIVTAWVPLLEVSEMNGCMQVSS